MIASIDLAIKKLAKVKSLYYIYVNFVRLDNDDSWFLKISHEYGQDTYEVNL